MRWVQSACILLVGCTFLAILAIPTRVRASAVAVERTPVLSTAHFWDDVPPSGLPLGAATACGGTPLTRTFNVTESFTVQDVRLGLTIDHSFRGDLGVVLESPTGTRVEAIAVSGDGLQHYDLMLDDLSANPINDGDADDTTAPYYDRSAAPVSSFDLFNGESSLGEWAIEICDDFGPSDDGTYLRSRLTLESVAPIPDLNASTFAGSRDLVRSGQVLSYTILLRNDGSAPATAVRLTDTFPVETSYVSGTLSTSGNPVAATYDDASREIRWGPASIGVGEQVTISYDAFLTATTGTFTQSATVTGDNLTATLLLESPTTLFSGEGSDATYTYADSLTAGGPTYNWLDATTGTAILTTTAAADDGEVTVVMPFPMTFYSMTTDTLRIGNNGAVLVGATSGEVAVANTPMASAPSPFIAPFWDDISEERGAVYVQTFGSAPTRIYVVEWSGRPHFDNLGELSFQLLIYEGSNRLVFQYADTDVGNPAFDRGRSATVGIRGNTIEYSYQQGVLENGLAIRFDPPPSAITLASFHAEREGEGVRIRWETASELQNEGFHLYRTTHPNGPLVRLNARLIPAQFPGTIQGGTYDWFDLPPPSEETLFYWLEDVATDGSVTRHGPVALTPGVTAVALQAFHSATAPRTILPPAALLLLVAGALPLRRRLRGR